MTNINFGCDRIVWWPSTTSCVVANTIGLWRTRRVLSRRTSIPSLYRPCQTTSNLNSARTKTRRVVRWFQNYEWGTVVRHSKKWQGAKLSLSHLDNKKRTFWLRSHRVGIFRACMNSEKYYSAMKYEASEMSKWVQWRTLSPSLWRLH